jgi:putative ABC transport system permease protein
MTIWRPISRGLQALLGRRADRDLADEVDHFYAAAAEELVDRGLSPREAERRVRVQLGSSAAVSEHVRESGWEHHVETLGADFRYAARRLRGHPSFTLACVISLALGIGASSAIFGAVNPILFEPLPYPDADLLVAIWDQGLDHRRLDVTFGNFREVAERGRSFDALAVMRAWLPTLTDGGPPERLDGQRVSAGYFKVLGVTPVLGRDFEPAEDERGGPAVAIISHALWLRRFGGDPAILGRSIPLDGESVIVIGVLPPSFENILAPEADIWAPLQYDRTLPADGREWGHHLRMAGRLTRGATVETAQRDLEAIARVGVPEFVRPRWAALEPPFTAHALQDDVTSTVRPALGAVLGAVALLLAIVCVNVTNLLLARGATRRGEFAMRSALGASRGRIVRQLIAESILLSAIGGILGVAVAQAGTRALVALTPSGLPRAAAIGVDTSVLLFTITLTIVIGVALGVVSGLCIVGRDLQGAVQRTSPRLAGPRDLTRRWLVIAEVALAAVLLLGAGLLQRTLERLFAVDPGFRSEHLLTLQVQTSGPRFQDETRTLRFFDAALTAVRGVPGVAGAAVTSQLPLSGDFDVYGVRFESSTAPITALDGGAYRYSVSPGFFGTMGIPIRRGRALDDRDTADAPMSVVINESLARRRFPGQDPLGQRMHIGQPSGPWYTIVGVAGDVKQASLAASQADAAYLTAPQWQFADRALWFVVRAYGDAAALVPAIKAAIWSVDKDQPIVRVATMDQRLAASAAERRFAAVLFELFGFAALALAGVGVYGLIAGDVASRSREIGIRSALGASRLTLLTATLRQGLALTVWGVLIGLAGSLAVTRALVTLLFNVSPTDPLTLVSVLGMLAAVSAAACFLPALRAARIDPAMTLRVE